MQEILKSLINSAVAAAPSAEVQTAADEMLKVILTRNLTYKEAQQAADLVERAVNHAAQHAATDLLRSTPFTARGCAGH